MSNVRSGHLMRRTLVLACLVALPAGAHAAESVRIGGTGMAIALMRGIADQVTAQAPDLTINVLPSMGSTGGLQALSDGVVQIAMTARPLKAGEQAAGLHTVACAATPLVFATSHPKPDTIRRQDLPAAFADPQATWSDGTPLKVIIRATSGSEMPYLVSQDPGFGPAFEAARRRPGMAVGVTDQENAELARRITGSLAIMTLLQVRGEALDLRVVPVDGVDPSPESLGAGTYPYAAHLCLVLPTKPTFGARRVIQQVRSEAGRTWFRQLGAEPLD